MGFVERMLGNLMDGGLGLRAEFDGQKVAVGNARLFDGEPIPEGIQQQAMRLEAEGKTTMLIQADGQFLGGTLRSWDQRPVFGVPWGALAIVAACLCWAIDNNLTRKVSASDAVQIAGSKAW
jgi:hypothetical protein